MSLAIGLFAIGVLLSAFFSGSETGLFRVTRVRLVIDALGGDRFARWLLWLTNHPSVFVATVLIGNNLANYCVSLGIILGVQILLPTSSQWPALLAPIVLAPIVFVYGESMPKTVFFNSPNRMLRRAAPALILAALLFSPVIALLWVISRVLERIIGASPQKVQLGLARRELGHVFEEGHEAGLLRPSQRALAQGLISFANRPVGEFVIPATRMIFATNAMSKSEIMHLARRHRVTMLPVAEAVGRRRMIGYIQVVDLYLDDSDRVPHPRPLIVIRATDQFLPALMRLQKEAASLGRVVNDDGRTIGYVTARHLSKTLFRGE